MGVSKTSDYIQNKILMPYTNQELQASLKALNQELKDIDILCAFKVKIESQNPERWDIKDR